VWLVCESGDGTTEFVYDNEADANEHVRIKRDGRDGRYRARGLEPPTWSYLFVEEMEVLDKLSSTLDSE